MRGHFIPKKNSLSSIFSSWERKLVDLLNRIPWNGRLKPVCG
jgi:hypothetical protein